MFYTHRKQSGRITIHCLPLMHQIREKKKINFIFYFILFCRIYICYNEHIRVHSLKGKLKCLLNSESWPLGFNRETSVIKFTFSRDSFSARRSVSSSSRAVTLSSSCLRLCFSLLNLDCACSEVSWSSGI